jgi:dTDP-4-amino-4,6-dideoxygalactose transaminase
VPFNDLAALHAPLEGEFIEALRRVLMASNFVLGAEVERFEQEFAAYNDAQHCVAVSNGTAALQVALMALGVGPGDEVVTVPHTFIATAEAITATGARPVFVDVDPASYTMDATLVERAITKKTRALIPVHLYGQCADMDPLLEIAVRRGIPVIEDACQAHGAEYRGRKAGTLGQAGCFSFYPGKNLGALGEGGAVITNDAAIAEKMRMLRDHGARKKYEHDFPAYNFRLEGLQGAFLAIKLKHLDGWNERRRSIAERYTTKLENSGVMTAAEMAYGRHVYHLYVVTSGDRDRLKNELSKRGIETGLHYPIPLHLQEAYRSLGHRPGDFPVAEVLARTCLSLPIFPGMSNEAVDHVAASVCEVLETRKAGASAR